MSVFGVDQLKQLDSSLSALRTQIVDEVKVAIRSELALALGCARQDPTMIGRHMDMKSCFSELNALTAELGDISLATAAMSPRDTRGSAPARRDPVVKSEEALPLAEIRTLLDKSKLSVDDMSGKIRDLPGHIIVSRTLQAEGIKRVESALENFSRRSEEDTRALDLQLAELTRLCASAFMSNGGHAGADEPSPLQSLSSSKRLPQGKPFPQSRLGEEPSKPIASCDTCVAARLKFSSPSRVSKEPVAALAAFRNS